MATDCELLLRYARTRDEPAFNEVVRQHGDLVYSVALRVVAGDAHLAQDVVQTVLTKLARHAAVLARRKSIVGWLHTTTRRAAIDAIRGERRWHAREQEAVSMQNDPITPDPEWAQLRPILDEALGRLRERDREAILLRYFNGLSHQEVAATLGMTEGSAQKCVERALEKLRSNFRRLGVAVSPATLASAMSANSVHSAPIGVIATASGSALAVGKSAVGWHASLLASFLFMTTAARITLVAVAIAGGGICFLIVRTPPPLSSGAADPKVTSMANDSSPAPPPADRIVSKGISAAKVSIKSADSKSGTEKASSASALIDVGGSITKSGVALPRLSELDASIFNYSAVPKKSEIETMKTLATVVADNRRYKVLFQKLGLDQDGIDALLELLVKRQGAANAALAYLDDTMFQLKVPELHTITLVTLADGNEMIRREAAATTPVDDEIRKFLGNDAYAVYHDYQEKLTARIAVENFQGWLGALQGPRLNDPQFEALVAAVYADNPGPYPDVFLGLFTSKVLTQAATFLDPAMLANLEQHAKNQEALRWQFKMQKRPTKSDL